MLEIKITVHMSKEGDNHFGFSITDRNFSVYVRDTNFCVCLEGKKENPSKLSIADTDFCVYVSPDLLIHTFSFTFSWNLLIVFEFSGSLQFSSVAQSCLTLQLHESHHAQPRCPSPTLGAYSNSCPSSRWCHPAISSSVVPLSSCPQSLPASESFPMSQLFTWRGQSIGVSALASVLPMSTQDWSPLGWTGWISLQSEGLSRVFSNTRVQKHQFFGDHLSSQSNSHIHTWPLEKP